MKIVADAEELGELEKLSDAELVKLVREGFQQFRQGADDMPGNVASSKPIEDDPPPTPGTPRPERDGARLSAHDAAAVRDFGLGQSRALEEHRIRQSGTANLEGELHLASIRDSRPVDPRMDQVIPGYSRLK